jgi:hypothetical protein
MGVILGDSWINCVVVSQSPAGKYVSKEAEDICRIRDHAMTLDVVN